MGAGPREGIKRAEALVHAEADVIVVDTAHGHSERVINTVREIKTLYLGSTHRRKRCHRTWASALIEASVCRVCKSWNRIVLDMHDSHSNRSSNTIPTACLDRKYHKNLAIA
ncbi:IMP dehydrogenase / GMP reductase domain protein [Anaplasma phagocytophilum str. CR1007]|nr:inosine-5'-monophosphate dehydrogenase [Anaplasma phagocytophilum str. HGE1]KJZ98531.1 IMP dehydrogenase / GMP reductase domain protein [Anaplasma phagocytophilum str. CR1007]